MIHSLEKFAIFMAIFFSGCVSFLATTVLPSAEVRRKRITRVCLYSSCVAVAAHRNFIAKLSILTSAR